MPETEQPQIDSEEVATQKETIEGRPEEAEQAPEKTPEQLKQEITVKKEAFTKDRDTVAEELRKLEELGDEADIEELTGIRAELADIDEQMEKLEAEEKALTAPETTETKAEEKTYGAQDVDELFTKAQEREATMHPAYKDNKKDKYIGDSRAIIDLINAKKKSSDDSKSLLASLDASGIQRLKEIASENRKQDQYVEPGRTTNAEKFEKVVGLAEQLASLRSEDGQKKFVQEITQSLEAGQKLDSKTIDKLDAALRLLGKHDKDTKKRIFEQIKPVLVAASEKSGDELDKGTVDRIVEEYQS
ncbi:MAG: hypothetical protein PHN19_05905 [Patescibacteria group bacterium]|nr:hypothetical protein [Patescibacteria group bacterium]